MSSALKGKLPSKFEYFYMRKNGTFGWAESHFGIIRQNGKMIKLRLYITQLYLLAKKEMGVWLITQSLNWNQH